MSIAPTSSNSSGYENRTWSGSASKKSRRTDSGAPENDSGWRCDSRCLQDYSFCCRIRDNNFGDIGSAFTG